MQALRPLLRSCQRPSSGRLAGPSQCFRLSAIRTHGAQYRAQHDNLGPHKEYFQTPGREPKPDLTPYVREHQQQQQQQQPQPHSSLEPHSRFKPSEANATDSTEAPPAKSHGWLRVPRLLRSAIWFFLFLNLGAITGTGLVTWEYLSPPFEAGSPEEQELVEEILDALDIHPIVDDLRENGWMEVEAFTPDLKQGLKGKNLVHQVLGGNNTQGIFMRVFHHPEQEFTMLVFFLGFGLEAGPDTVHAGIVASLLQEALSKHMAYYYPGYFITPQTRTSIDYQKQCRPGDIYGMFVAPSGRDYTTSGNVHVTKLQLTSVLAQLAGAPVMQTSYDINTNTESHAVSMPAQNQKQPTHAVCQAELKIVPKQLSRDGKAFEVGGKDDEGLAKVLSALTSSPGYQNWQTTTSKDDKKEEGEDK